MYEKCFSFLLHSSFSGKMAFPGKLKLIYPSTLKHYNNCSAPNFLIFFKSCLAPPLYKKEGRDYAFYMWHCKGETIKLFPFFMTDFLFTELLNHNIWRKLTNHVKNDIPNIPSHLHISDSNLLWYEFHHIVIRFHHKIPLDFEIILWLTASGGLFFVTHKKCIFLDISAKFVFKN